MVKCRRHQPDDGSSYYKAAEGLKPQQRAKSRNNTGRLSILRKKDEGIRIRAEGTGDFLMRFRVDGLWHDGVLHDVLFIPNLGANLFSVRTAAARGVCFFI